MAPRFGVIGAGALGYHHVRLLRDLTGDDFAGFHDRNPERAASVAADLKVRAHDSVASLLAECDAVSVVTATTAHHAVARLAIEAGKHVFIEKPITVTLAEADELLALAGAQGVLVQVGHVERFNRAVRAAWPHIRGPKFIESDRLAPFTSRGADVAVVLDLMIHDIDLILALLESEVTAVDAVGVNVLTPTADIANARLTFASGAVANITASRVSADRTRKLRIFQPSGYISLDLAAGSGAFFRLREGLDFATLAKGRGPLAMEAFVEVVPLEAPEGEPLKLELDAFSKAVRGEGPVLVPGAEGRQALDVALRVMAAIERSLPAMTAPAHARA